MLTLGPEARWTIAAVLLGLAAAAIHIARRQIVLLMAAVALAPLPAIFFLRLSNEQPADAPEDQAAAGLMLVAITCYLAPALGALTARLIERATGGGVAAEAQPAERQTSES